MTTNLEVPTQTAALKTGWLDAQPTSTPNLSVTANAGSLLNGTATNYCYQTAYWPNGNTYWYYYPTVERRPIRLGLSEVEKLRSAAKRDAKLKKILEKFTDQIEVAVDFK